MFDLKRFRKDKGLKQSEIAFMFECTQSNIAMMEKDMKDLLPYQVEILTKNYGDISDYNVTDLSNNNINDIGNPNRIWEDLINKYYESNQKLIELLEKEKIEKGKMLETINMLTQALLEKKAV